MEPADLQRLAQHLDVSELLALFVHPRLALGLSERDFTEVLGLPGCLWDSQAALHQSHLRQTGQHVLRMHESMKPEHELAA